MTQNQQHVSNQKTKIVGSTGRLARPYYTKCDSEFQMWLYYHSTPLHKCNICATYFDCTTYYYDISKSDIDDHDEDENVLKKDIESMVQKRITAKTRLSIWICWSMQTRFPYLMDCCLVMNPKKSNIPPIIKRPKRRFGLEKTLIVTDRGGLITRLISIHRSFLVPCPHCSAYGTFIVSWYYALISP